MNRRISVRRATPADAATLGSLGRTTFTETFVDGFRIPYSAEDVETFFASAYSVEAVSASLAHPAITWWIAERDGVAAGFAMIGPCALPHPEVAPNEGELKRLYVLGEHQGHGIGRKLLDLCLEALAVQFSGRQWIGVWSGNEKAQRLYKWYGFEKVGEYEFPVGSVRDREFILRRDRREP